MSKKITKFFLLFLLFCSLFVIIKKANAADMSNGTLYKINVNGNNVLNAVSNNISHAVPFYGLPNLSQWEINYSNALVDSYDWNPSQLSVSDNSLFNSWGTGTNVTLKPGSKYLIKTANNSQHYKVDHDNYIVPVSANDYPSATILLISDALFNDYLVTNSAVNSLIISVNNNSIQADNKAAIYWNTNLEATCGIDYSINSNLSGSIGTNGQLVQYGNSTNGGKYVYYIQLNGLLPNTDYYYKVNCAVGSGPTTSSQINKLSNPKINIQEISNSKILSDNSATIDWTTNIESTCNVLYSQNANLENSQSSLGKIFQTSATEVKNYYEAKLPNLSLGVKYYYKIQCSLSSTNTSESGIFEIPATATVPTLNVSLDASTPSSASLSSGQTNITFAKIKLTAGSEAVNNMNKIQIGSDSSNASSFLNNFKVYDGATLLTSSVGDLISNGDYYYLWLNVSGFSVPASGSKILTVIADVKSAAPTGSVRLGIAGWNFDLPGASVNPSSTAIYGNKMTVAVSGDQPKVCTVCVGGTDTGKIDSNGCKIYSCQETNLISEKVKCWFKGSQTEQKCYMAGDNDKFTCSGKESCIMDVTRTKGEKITWKSSCGGYAYTTMDGTGGYDGRGEYAEFNCVPAATSSGVSTVPAATTTATPVPTESKVEIIDMQYNAKNMVDNKYDSILSELKQLRDTIKEQQNEIKYLKSMTADLRNMSDQMKGAINDFITYGVDANTVKLGAGERAAVINSYKTAFAKLPETEAELTDAIKIANGRFPSLTSDTAEKQAKEQFIKIYKRVADLNDANDNAAIKVMAYGLRQKAENRNLNSEKAGIKTFKSIYGYNPKSTQDWNTMQAITYSGASRGVDTDGDLLTDDREAELGTDPNNPDTDGDGFKDGVEVNDGFNPKGAGKL